VQDCTPLYEKFLDAAAKAGCAIELNTAGLRKDCKEIYPCRDLLEIAFRKNVPITFGSDAHAPAEVGMDFAAAVALARSVGYTETLQFKQRSAEATWL
jgi:histidinol-phosphatase (PHP family)